MPTQPQDHLDAVKAEAKQQPAVVVFRDVKFTIAPADSWLLDFAHWADRDKITLALAAALGETQYEKFRTLQPRPSMTEAGELIEQIVSAFKLDAGE